MDADTATLSSVHKACRILASLSDPRTSRLTDVAQVTGLDKATVLRLLDALRSAGFVERDPEDKRYTLGPQVYALHRAMVHGLDIQAMSRPSLIRLAREFGDTAILSVPIGSESVCVDLYAGDYPIRANYLTVGSRRPLGAGAGSLALLAGLDDTERLALRPELERGITRYPRLSMDKLEQEVADTRQRGYALLLDVIVEKMGGIAICVRGPDGRAIAALSIAALSERIEGRAQALADALRREARDIERLWMPDPTPVAPRKAAGGASSGVAP